MSSLIHLLGTCYCLMEYYKLAKVCPCGYSPIANTVTHFLYMNYNVLVSAFYHLVTQKYIISKVFLVS